jgi:hypothetical protein
MGLSVGYFDDQLDLNDVERQLRHADRRARPTVVTEHVDGNDEHPSITSGCG